MNEQEILERYEIARKTRNECNCIGTSFYLSGLANSDCYIPHLREPLISASSDLLDSNRFISGGLIAIFGGYTDKDSGKFIRQGVRHIGVSVDIGGEKKVMHRFGYNGPLLFESLENNSSEFYNYVKIGFFPLLRHYEGSDEFPLRRVSYSPISFFEVFRNPASENSILSLLKKEKDSLKTGLPKL